MQGTRRWQLQRNTCKVAALWGHTKLSEELETAVVVFKENSFPNLGPISLQPMALQENAQSLAGITFHGPRSPAGICSDC